jgi:hypothetical protein
VRSGFDAVDVHETSPVCVTGTVIINENLVVQGYAGQSNPQTTLRYAQAIDVDEAIAAVETLNY